jgi:histidine kinase
MWSFPWKRPTTKFSWRNGASSGWPVFRLSHHRSIIFVFVLRFVNHPIKRLIDGTRLIARGDYTSKVQVEKMDELGQMAAAINQMGDDIASSQEELNKQRDEYQNLFERCPA